MTEDAGGEVVELTPVAPLLDANREVDRMDYPDRENEQIPAYILSGHKVNGRSSMNISTGRRSGTAWV